MHCYDDRCVCKSHDHHQKMTHFFFCASAAIIGYHTPRQFSFLFFVFSALPTIIATGDEKLHRNLMRVWGEGNVIRNTLTPLHL